LDMEFPQFLMSLDPTEFNDRMLLNMLNEYPEEIMRKSGKPVAIVALRKKGMVFNNGFWAKDTYTQLEVFADMHGRFIRYAYASKPLFDVGNGYYTHTLEQEFGSKSAMSRGKAFMYALEVCISERISKAFYGVGDTKYLIENTVNMWKEKIA